MIEIEGNTLEEQRLSIAKSVFARLMDGTGRAYSKQMGNCTYRIKKRGGPLMKCAVGIFLPDHSRAGKYEGDVYGLLEDFSKTQWAKNLEKHADLLFALQAVHDNLDHWDSETNTLNEFGVRAFNVIMNRHNIAFKATL